jgi:hypothetical protein
MGPVAKIIVRYLDGRVVKGYTQHFNPDGSRLHLRATATGVSSEMRAALQMEDLKAIFFVRTFDGDPHWCARREFIEGDESYGDRVEVTFGDGEVVRGFKIDPYHHRSGFFLLPPDPKGNTVMTFVVSTAIKDIRHFPAALTSAA